MKKANNPLTSVPNQAGRRPVRVKLRRVTASLAKAYPPDGENLVWWNRLKQALGTSSSDFVNASLYQLQAAAQLPCSGISEMALNAALAMIESAAPRDEIEAALAIQMACTHAAAMSVGRHKDFRDQYALAREAQADDILEQIYDIAHDSIRDYVKKIGADGKVIWVVDRKHIARCRLRINTLFRIVALLRPKKYGHH